MNLAGIITATLIIFVVDLYWILFAPPTSWWKKLMWDIELPRLSSEITDPDELTLLKPRLWLADSWKSKLLGQFWHIPLSIKLLILAGLLLANCTTFALLIVLIFGANSPVLVIIALALDFFGAFLPLIFLLFGK